MNNILIFLIIVYLMIVPIAMLKIHPCYLESYIETINIRDCSNVPIEIETTRCRGQCYSEDFLIYDWQIEPKHYRHKHYIHCCSPNITISREISIPCQNKQQQILKYSVVTHCECKSCTDNCEE